MDTVTSADGILIAFDRFGDGPPVILAAGAFNDRTTTEPLARALAPRFTAFNYDRRGRGDSGDTAPYSVQREIEDIAALISTTGAPAALFGYSSGANLMLQAAASGLEISKVVLYEPPFNPDDSYPTLPGDLASRLAELVASGRRGDAVELYQITAVGTPPIGCRADAPRAVPPGPGSDRAHPRLRRSLRRRPVPADRTDQLDPHPSPGDQRRPEPALHAGGRPGRHRRASQRAAAHARWPGPRHRPRSHRPRRTPLRRRPRCPHEGHQRWARRTPSATLLLHSVAHSRTKQWEDQPSCFTCSRW
jgi:Alpha/beta hydrolase family